MAVVVCWKMDIGHNLWIYNLWQFNKPFVGKEYKA